MRIGLKASTAALLLVGVCATAHATMIIEHVGTTYPATESWNYVYGGGSAVEPGDGSVPPALEPAWRTAGGVCMWGYHGIPTSVVDEAYALGWTLEARVRLREPLGLVPNSAVFFTWTSGLGHGDERIYGLSLWGGDDGHLWLGRSWVEVWGDWPNGGYDTGKPWDDLHDYEFTYDPAVSDPAERVSFYMDGDFVSYAAGDSLVELGWYYDGRVDWGAGDSGGTGVADWSLVRLSMAPGLPAFALIGVGPLAAGLARRLRRR